VTSQEEQIWNAAYAAAWVQSFGKVLAIRTDLIMSGLPDGSAKNAILNQQWLETAASDHSHYARALADLSVEQFRALQRKTSDA